jgi:hypothetical protein
MRQQYKYTISTELFGKSVELLHKYFGITLAYFEPEFKQLPSFDKSIKSLTPYKDTLNDEKFITLTGYVCEKHREMLFDWIEENDDIDSIIIEAIRILDAILLESRPELVSRENNDEIQKEWDYSLVREDMLRLYVFMHESFSESKEIKLKKGKQTIKLNNHFNWALDRMATLYLGKYLSDITTVEQAQEELAKYKKRGRHHENRNVNVVLYGIYRMFSEEKKMKSKASDALCNMIVNFLKLAGLISDNDVYVNIAWVRSQIRYMSGQDNPPRFVERASEFQPCKIRDLKEAGRPMF